MVRGCASRWLVARVATAFKRVRDTVSPAPGLWTEGEMRKGVDRRRRVRAHLERVNRSEEHTSELQSLMRSSYAVFCMKTNKQQTTMKTLNKIIVAKNKDVYQHTKRQERTQIERIK